MRRQLLAILLAAAAVVPTAPARATVLVPADLVELSRSAALVVRGTVTAVTSQWADGRRRVETLVTLDVQQAIKGAGGATVTFKVPGGDMGRYRSVMIGAPTFRVGEEVILFLGARPPALPFLLGLGQGVYRVQRDERTGAARVISPVLAADSAESVRVRRGDPSRRAPSVEEFAAQVREANAPRDKGQRPPTRDPGRDVR